VTRSVLFSVPEGRKIVLGNYNYPSRRDGHSVRTDASRDLTTLLPSLRDGQ